MLELLGAIALLLVCSAICSMTEAALFSLPITKARQMGEKSQNGRIVQTIRENPARPVSVIVIFNNMANIVGTYLVASLAATRLSHSAQAWFPFALTAAVIILSEIIPKTVGERFCQAIMYATARPLSWISWALTPVVWSIEQITAIFTRGRVSTITSEQEIRALCRIGEQEGVIDKDESLMIGKIFELDDVVAGDIMTPRTALTWIRGIEPISVAKEKISHSQHSRILVVGETMDEVKGIFLKNKMLALLIEGHDENSVIEDFVEEVKLVSEEEPADELLAYFKESRVHLCVVIDEYGGTSGIVTLEDVLEVLTGEIMDETDRHMDMRDVARKHGILRLQGSQNGKRSRGTNADRGAQTRNGKLTVVPVTSGEKAQHPDLDSPAAAKAKIG